MWAVKGRLFGAVLVAGTLLVSGCASTPQVQTGNQYSDLYDGKSELAFSTLMPVATAEEAIARGDQAYQAGNLDQAVFEYIRSLDLDPDNADTFFRIGAINMQKKSFDKAASAFRFSLDRNPDHPGALEGMGLILLQQRAYDQARGMLELAVEKDSKRWRSFNALGILADLRKDFVVARINYGRALDLVPGSARVHNNLGYSFYLVGQWRNAEREYRAALNADPWHERAWRNLGQLYTRLGRYDEARDVLSEVMSEADAYNTIGYICMNDGKYRKAESFFTLATKASPSYHVIANENLAQVRRLVARHGNN